MPDILCLDFSYNHAPSPNNIVCTLHLIVLIMICMHHVTMAGFIFLAQIFLYLPKLYWPFFVTVTYTDYDSHGSFHVTHTKYSYIKNTVIHDNIFKYFTICIRSSEIKCSLHNVLYKFSEFKLNVLGLEL